LTNVYTFTPTATLATDDVVIVQLYDAVNVIDVTKIGTRYYKGATPSFLGN
jgi:hypothetical protein